MKRVTFVFAGLIAITVFILFTKPDAETNKKAKVVTYENSSPKVFN